MLIITPEEELMKLEHDKLILEKKIEIAKLRVELWYLEYDLYYRELEKQPQPWPEGMGKVVELKAEVKSDAGTISI